MIKQIFSFSRVRCYFIIVIMVLSIFGIIAISGQEENKDIMENDYDFTSKNISAIDALGRKLPKIQGYRDDRYVGIFYFNWLGNQGESQTEVYDITKLLKEDREQLFKIGKNTFAPVRFNYFFNEPLFGYYNNADPWVIRKHIELFIAADIDFMAIDLTNGIIYDKVLPVLLDLLLEYQEAGWKVPKVIFFTNRKSGDVVSTLYRTVYRKEEYVNLWFYGNKDKPYIIAWAEELSQPMLDFFYIRPPQWPEAEFEASGFPYVEKVRPQRVFTDLMSVSVAQHTGNAFSLSVQGVDGKIKESWGRGYTTSKSTNGDITAIQRGDNFQEQWDVAIKADPEMIFITGWNEWTALKLTADWSKDISYWVDTFNTEFSRDIEMTKARNYIKDEDGGFIQEGYGDNFYLQMISNIRRYKGIPLDVKDETVPVSLSIDISGEMSQWDKVKNRYLNISTDKIERDSYGYVRTKKYYYTQDAPKNFITDIKVTYDNENLYFLINTKDDITVNEEGSSNWMNLLISVKGLDTPSWEGFQFVVNRNHSSSEKTSLEKVSKENTYSFENVSELDYKVKGNSMQIVIPKKDLSIDKELFEISFKVTDSIENESDIMDYYVSGDSVPLGRLAYSFTNMNAKHQLKASRKNNTKVLSTLETVVLGISLAAIGLCSFIFIKYKKNREKL